MEIIGMDPITVNDRDGLSGTFEGLGTIGEDVVQCSAYIRPAFWPSEYMLRSLFHDEIGNLRIISVRLMAVTSHQTCLEIDIEAYDGAPEGDISTSEFVPVFEQLLSGISAYTFPR